MVEELSEVLSLGTNWTTWHSMVGQEACKISHKMDSGMWQTIGKTKFLRGKHGSALSIGFVSRLRLCCWPWGLKINLGESCLISEVEHLSPQVGCARSKFLSRTVLQSLRLFLWMLELRMDSLFALDLWDMVIEVLRSNNNTDQPKHYSIQESGATLQSKTKTQNVKRRQNVEQLNDVDYILTNTHSSQGESQLCIFEDNEVVIKMIIKGPSPTMRHVSRTHRVALDWLFDRISLEPKNWHQEPTRRHSDQRKHLKRWMESPSSFVQHYEFLDVFLVAISVVFFLTIRLESRAPWKRGQKTISNEVSDGESETMPGGTRPEEWGHLFTKFGIWSIRKNTERKEVWIAAGNSRREN